jgi:HEAT repeat protein
MTTSRELLRDALSSSDPSARLKTALSAGTYPDPTYVDVLIQRCAVEPDFYVRDMLTWALTRHSASLTVPLLLAEATTGSSQARSQALHTLSKVRDPRGWSVIDRRLLQDPDDEVARSAWRAAVVLVPEGSEAELASALATQLGRGDRNVQLSLSRALAALGDPAAPALAEAAERSDETVRAHAIATQRLVLDPDEGFDAAIFEAKRHIALKDAPIPQDEHVDR